MKLHTCTGGLRLKLATLLSLLVIFTQWGGSSRAAVIDAQFVEQLGAPQWAAGGPFSGAAAIGANGDFWNTISGLTGASQQFALTDVNMVPTPVIAQAFVSSYWTEDAQHQTFAGTPYERLMGQYATNVSGNPQGLVVLSHLDPGVYDLYLYSAGATDGQTRVTQFAANDAQGTVGPNAFATTLLPGVNYLHLQPTVGSNGLLSINFQGMVPQTSGFEGDFNGFQLAPAPEPGSAAIMLVSGTRLLMRRRRKNLHPAESVLVAATES